MPSTAKDTTHIFSVLMQKSSHMHVKLPSFNFVQAAFPVWKQLVHWNHQGSSTPAVVQLWKRRTCSNLQLHEFAQHAAAKCLCSHKQDKAAAFSQTRPTLHRSKLSHRPAFTMPWRTLSNFLQETRQSGQRRQRRCSENGREEGEEERMYRRDENGVRTKKGQRTYISVSPSAGSWPFCSRVPDAINNLSANVTQSPVIKTNSVGVTVLCESINTHWNFTHFIKFLFHWKFNKVYVINQNRRWTSATLSRGLLTQTAFMTGLQLLINSTPAEGEHPLSIMLPPPCSTVGWWV